MMTVKVIGGQLLKKWSREKAKKIQRNRSLYAKSVTIVDRWIQLNFRMEGKQVGGWQPLAASTKALRRNKNKGKILILQDNGDLRGDWDHFWNDRRGVVESKTEYAVYHNSDEPRTKLPQRRITPRNEEIKPDLVKLFGRTIDKVLND